MNNNLKDISINVTPSQKPNSNSILDYWPIESPPRANQIEALKWMEEMSSKYKYLICESPVGSGKSLLGLTFARWKSGCSPKEESLPGNAFVLTPQKILQQQYMNEFSDNDLIKAAQLFGKANYQCSIADCDCEAGSSILKCDCSVFNEARDKLLNSSTAIMNYSSACSYFKYAPQFIPARKTMVLDECHNLEELLVNFEGVEISKARCDYLDIKYRGTQISDMTGLINWINTDVLPAATYKRDILKDELEAMSSTDTFLNKKASKLASILRFITSLRGIQSVTREEFDNEYVVVRGLTSVTLKPIFPRRAFMSFMEPKADSFVFMSGTIPDPEEFCTNLGIDLDQAAFLRLDSSFPAKNRPVVYIPTMKVNAKWKENEEGLQEMKKIINAICDEHSSDNGIIHTTNYQVSEWVVDYLNEIGTHRVYHHNPLKSSNKTVSREKVINDFTHAVEPSVLVSPSVTEGVDLKGDKGRFNIVVKLPYPYLGDQWVKKRMELSSKWYAQRTLIDLLQASGRTTRTADDNSVFYILDQNWSFLFSTAKHMVPKWWYENYQKL